MKEKEEEFRMRKYHILIAALVVVLDRLTKWVIAQKITLHDSVDIVPGVFRLTHVQNQGAAFGLFSESPSEWKAAMLILFSVAALAVVSALLWKNGNAMNATAIALSLVFGGALGNLWDRVATGRVVDFLDFYLGSHHWPAFNIADSAIVVGALLLLSEIFWAAPSENPVKESTGT
ncbi:MAG TPA: signal peptidase II [Terriglobales bacterium]|jgi:signal peptidase II|nr:signal peptidase II [Terriglobales bacterium]